MSYPASRSDQLGDELERQRDMLRRQREQDARVLAALYNISLACRDQPTYQQVFEAIYYELQTVFTFDAFFVAFCDSEQEEVFRASLLADEGELIFLEGDPYSSLSRQIISRREPLLFRDLLTEWHRRRPDEATNMFGSPRYSRAWLGVPLMIGGNAIGVLSIQSYTVGLYDESTRDLLQRMANVVAVALENVRLLDLQQQLSSALQSQVADRTRQFDALSELAEAIVGRQPLAAFLDRALNVTLGLLGLPAGNVRLLDASRTHLDLIAHQGFSEAYARHIARSRLASSPIRPVVEERRAIIVPRGWQQLRSGGNFPIHLFPQFESMISVPMAVGADVLGTLSLFGHESRDFTPDEINLTQAVANQIAVAIENTRLLEEHERQISELQALSRISRAASTAHDISSLLRIVHDALQAFLPLDAFSMVVYDPDREVITDALSIDEGRAFDYWTNEPPPPGSLTGWIIRNRQGLLFVDLPAEIERFPDVAAVILGSNRPARSWIGMPLVERDGRVIGAINVQSYSAGVFSGRDESFMRDVAAQLTLHVQNVGLLTQRERQIRELDVIGQIGQLVTASYELDTILDGVQQAITGLTEASVFFLLICDPDQLVVTNALFVEEGRSLDTGLIGKPLNPGTMSDWIVQHREPLLFQDLTAQRAELAARGIVPSPIGPANPVRSWAGVPLVARNGGVVGVLALQDYRAFRYDAQTIDFLSQVASHISLGVQKVRLFAAEQEARRTAETLREIARVISASFDPAEVLRLVLAELRKLITYDTASLMLVESDTLRIAAAQGWDSPLDPRGVTFPIESSGAGLVVRTGMPRSFDDIETASAWSHAITGRAIRSWLGVPLIARGRVIGVLNIDAGTPGRFTARDLEVAVTFANHAALALENAQLYQESVTRVEQEMEIAQRIQRNLFPRSLPVTQGLAVAATCIPARETGGDFFDVLDLGERRVGVIVGDVSGKSLPAAMLMAVARSTTRSEARNHEVPALVLEETNRWLVEDVPRNTFIAVGYALIDQAARRLTLASGGQLTPLRRSPDGAVTYLEPPGPALPLGLVRGLRYQQLEVPISPGDTLVFYTDGIVEAKDRSQQLFGFERLEAIVSRHGHLPPGQLVDLILDHVRIFAGEAPQHDDMTLVVVRVGG